MKMHSLVATVCACVWLVGCFSNSDSSTGAQGGGHTNWLECADFGDCAKHADAVACSDDGYCVDDTGGRVEVATTTGGSGGTSASGGSGGGASGSGAGESGTGGSGGTDGGAGAAGSGMDCTGVPCSGGACEPGFVPYTPPGECCPTRCDPATSSSCDTEGDTCCDPAPSDGPNYCAAGFECCADNTCSASCPTSSTSDIRIPECPGDSTERCASERCVTGGTCLECPSGQVCLEVNLSCGPAGGTTAQCIDDPCAGKTLDCACAASVCDGLEPAVGGWQCGAYTQDHFLVGASRDPFLACSGGGVCASPDTRIATPRGEVAIAELRVGDLVYSRDADGVVVVPLLSVARTSVTSHHVMRVVTDAGHVLEVSGPHPTADGRRLDALSVDDVVDDDGVVSIERIPYTHPFTHDILPASATGTYLANGVWLGSTLRR